MYTFFYQILGEKDDHRKTSQMMVMQTQHPAKDIA